MNNREAPSTFRLLGGLFRGGVTVALVCVFLKLFSDRAYLPVFCAVLGSTLVSGTILLIWMTRWALRDDGRVSQFGIGTLLMLTGLLAVYLSLARWLIYSGPVPSSEDSIPKFLTLCVVGPMVAVACFLPVLSMMTSLVWLAARIVRWGPIRGFLLGRVRRKIETRSNRGRS